MQAKIMTPEQIKTLFVKDRRLIVDHSSNLPSLGAENIRKGASPSLATLYVLRAFREDLKVIGRIGRDTKDFVKKPSEDKIINNSKFLRESHTLFFTLIHHYILVSNDSEVYRVLNQQNMDVFKHDGFWMFKDSETGFLAKLKEV